LADDFPGFFGEFLWSGCGELSGNHGFGVADERGRFKTLQDLSVVEIYLIVAKTQF